VPETTPPVKNNPIIVLSKVISTTVFKFIQLIGYIPLTSVDESDDKFVAVANVFNCAVPGFV
jgi:hypothetical protein